MVRVVTSCVLVVVCVSSTWAVEPANRRSNPQVKAVLKYFYSLSDRTENRIVSGQFTDFGNGSNLRIMERIHESVGQWPALLGADYADFRRGSITTKVPNALSKAAITSANVVAVDSTAPVHDPSPTVR